MTTSAWPTGWVLERLGNLGAWCSGGTPNMANAAYWNGDVPWVSPKDMKRPRLRDTEDHVTRAAVGNGTRLAPAGAVLVVVRGMILAHSAPVALLERPMAFNQDVKALAPWDGVDGEYVLQWLLWSKPRLLAATTESTHGTKKLASEDLFGLMAALPPLAEQRAIAAALRDVDELAAGLERLVAKKRDVKQAAMQRLLTGEQRLPGFDGEWGAERLGDVAEIVSGGTPSTSVPGYWDGDVAWCTPTDITGTGGKYLYETARSITRSGLENSGARLLPAGSLLLCSRATVGEVKIAARPVCTNQGFKSLIAGPDIDGEFLYYQILTMRAQMIERAIGSTFLELSARDATALRVVLPPLGEQRAIAAVLADMDAELAALDDRLTKTRALKQAMMQELLTGRTRLVPPTPEPSA